MPEDNAHIINGELWVNTRRTVFVSGLNNHLCPQCGEEPNGTGDFTSAVAYGSVENASDPKMRALVHAGETESEDVWNNQTTARLNGLPVLQCARGHWYITPHLAKIQGEEAS